MVRGGPTAAENAAAAAAALCGVVHAGPQKHHLVAEVVLKLRTGLQDRCGLIKPFLVNYLTRKARQPTKAARPLPDSPSSCLSVFLGCTLLQWSTQYCC